MTSEAMTAPAAGLSARASVALLTLQLRSALQEADAAEEEELRIDQAAALAQLRAQLEPLVDERRRCLAGALERVRNEAAAAAASARSRASAVVTEVVHVAPRLLPPRRIERVSPDIVELAQQLSESLREAADAEGEAAALDPDATRMQLLARLGPLMQERRRLLDAALAEARAESVVAIAAATREAALISVTATAERIGQPLADAANVGSSTFPPPTTSTAMAPALPAVVPTPITMVFDADNFAQAFATALATILDERGAIWRDGSPVAGMPTPVAEQRSFWSLAGHLDVFLVAISMVIVLVILAAWLA